MTLLARIDLRELRAVLNEKGLAGWLLYDFHGVNPVAQRVVGATGMCTRRMFVWLPATGTPVAVAHRIELQKFREFPGEVRRYSTWRELHRHLEDIVRGQRVAIEYSPDDSVPYLDRVPAGVVELLRKLGAEVRSSADLVTRFAARWSQSEVTDHRKAAEKLAEIATSTLREVVTKVGEATECGVQQSVLERLRREGLVWPDPPIVAFGPNSANPHYEPGDSSDAVLGEADVVLLDLWASVGPETVLADQTWMAFAGRDPPKEVLQVWTAVRDARDAAADLLRARCQAHESVTGADLDRAARAVISERGYGDCFIHRTGHSIDKDVHGSGPHLDDFETNDSRELVPGVGFTIEPGVYLEGRFGIRSEINVVLGEAGPELTPRQIQQHLLLPG